MKNMFIRLLDNKNSYFRNSLNKKVKFKIIKNNIAKSFQLKNESSLIQKQEELILKKIPLEFCDTKSQGLFYILETFSKSIVFQPIDELSLVHENKFSSTLEKKKISELKINDSILLFNDKINSFFSERITNILKFKCSDFNFDEKNRIHNYILNTTSNNVILNDVLFTTN